MQDDSYDKFVYHLSQSDKRDLLYGAFMLCMSAVALFSLVIGFSNMRVNRKNSENMMEVMEMIATYIGSATQDEYEEIAKTLRNDLVFSEYGQDMENYIQYIPNTTDNCRTCMDAFPSQVYLIYTNTGQPYDLDLFEPGEKPNEDDYDSTTMSFGYDEISETSLHIAKMPGQHIGNATIHRKQGILSVQRMKSLFCDDCIREILGTVEHQLVEEVIIFDAAQKKFYPVDSGTVVIGDYTLQIEYDHGDYEIDIKYTKTEP